MRPPKRILLIDADERRQSLTRYLLHTWGFAVLSANSSTGAAGMQNIDTVLAFWPVAEDRASRIARKNDAPFLLVMEAALSIPDDTLADRVLLCVNSSSAHIIDAVKLAVSRKRGPKKGSHHKPVASAARQKERAA